ncbi:MAG: anthranilate/aminodeoxychorismate synthase component II, partial [Planctomycetota bacterium]|nr:anthranilate/aminodeoxychorismate synthase component II [Planctomycetota bacterium]
MQVLVIDNYDSFTWNLVHLVHQVCPEAEVRVERNDAILIPEAEAWGPTHLLISPGPCTPAESGCSREMLTHFGGKIPALGVCLGHQSLADVHGGTVDRAPRLMHGKTSLIHHNNQGLHANLPNPFTAMRY